MKLYSNNYGSGPTLIIIHGLFGLSDNWASLAKRWAETFSVYCLDVRNHGQSPRSEDWNYDVMAEDILEFLNDRMIEKAFFIGHSMGGKIVMRFAEQHAERIEKMVIADIAPKYYEPHHHAVLEALNAVPLNTIKSRKEAEDILTKHIPDFGTKQFLLKNLYWKTPEQLDWKFNLEVISKNIERVGEACFEYGYCNVPTLFVRGEKSNYITKQDEEFISDHFLNSQVLSIPNAGHWVHAEAPDAFFNTVNGFLFI